MLELIGDRAEGGHRLGQAGIRRSVRPLRSADQRLTERATQHDFASLQAYLADRVTRAWPLTVEQADGDVAVTVTGQASTRSCSRAKARWMGSPRPVPAYHAAVRAAGCGPVVLGEAGDDEAGGPPA